MLEAKLQAVADEKLREKLAVLNAEQRAAEEVRQLKLRPLTPPYTPLHTLAHSCTPSHTHRHTHKHTAHVPLTHPSRTPHTPGAQAEWRPVGGGEGTAAASHRTARGAGTWVC